MFLRSALLVIVATVVVVSARLGGWSSADSHAPEVVQAVTYALRSKFPNLGSGEDASPAIYKIIDVKKQVVAGNLYDIILEYTPSEGACEVDHFQVGDRFGELSVLLSEKLSNACSAP